MSFRGAGLLVISLTLITSVSVRAFVTRGASDRSDAAGGAAAADAAEDAMSFGPGSPSPQLPDDLPDAGPTGSEDASPVADAMPYVTEGSFFALIGFALGFASKKVVKLLLILLAGFFVMVQAASYAGVVTVDWSRAVELANDLVLNLKDNQTIGEILKDRIPTAGALVTGFALGYRRG